MNIRKGLTLVLATLIFLPGKALSADKDKTSQEYRPLDSLSKWYSPIIKRKDELSIERESFSSEKVQALYRELETEMRIELTEDVMSNIHHFVTGQRHNFEIALSLGLYYRPLLEKAVADAHLPAEMVYLPFVLSGNHHQAVSPEGGVGLWRLNYYVAIKKGLTINAYIDERKDPVKSTTVALQYLNELYATYKSWNMAITAFAFSPAEVNKAVIKSGGSTNYWKIRPYLPEKARNLVSSFFASVYVTQFHIEHDMVPPAIVVPLQKEPLEINEMISFKLLSKKLNISEQSLQMLNPVHKGNMIHPQSVTGLPFYIPAGKVEQVGIMAEALIADSKKDIVEPKVVRKVPSYSQPVIPTDKTRVTYTVKSGDYLGKIAEYHGVGVSTLKRWNNLRSDRIDIGQKLVVYVDEDWKAPKTNTPKPSVTKPTTVPTVKVDPSLLMDYTVKDGDTLWQIAKDHPGNSIEKIQSINGISQSIKPGQVIKILKP